VAATVGRLEAGAPREYGAREKVARTRDDAGC